MGARLRILFAAGLLARPAPAGSWAQAAPRPRRSSGCDQFKWPIAHEQAALAAPAAGPLAPGATLPADAGARLKLVPFAEAKLALAPERPPKFSPSYAGAFALDAPAAAGVYKVTLSAGGWIDVVQDGKFLKADHLLRGDRLRQRAQEREIPACRRAGDAATDGRRRSREVSIIVSPE